MDISQFNCPITTVEKNRLFYGQYQYSGKFSLTELSVIRGLDIKKINHVVNFRNQMRAQSSHRGIMRNFITDEIVDDLKTTCILLAQYKDQMKFVVSYNQGYVYTNNLEILNKVKDLDFIQSFSISQVEIISAADCITLINPKWAYRTYFKQISVTEFQRDQLIQYLSNRENIKLSPGLKSWCLDNKNRWWDRLVQNYFFIDHNDLGELLFLNMVMPKITSKTFKLVAK
jgi:hypothetical protein